MYCLLFFAGILNLKYFIHCSVRVCDLSISSKSDVRGRDSFEELTNNSVEKNDNSPRKNRCSDDSIITAVNVFRRIRMCT